jgi:hypothetical protein
MISYAIFYYLLHIAAGGSRAQPIKINYNIKDKFIYKACSQINIIS